MEEEKEEIFATIITDMMERFALESTEIILPFSIDWLQERYKITIPQRGDKLKLLKLSEANVDAYIKEKEKQQDKLNPEQRKLRLMKQMQADLQLNKLPRHIECFDNSNTLGNLFLLAQYLEMANLRKASIESST